MWALMRAAVTALFLAGLPALVAAQPARLIGGVMCDSAEQIDALFNGVVVDGKPAGAVVDTINAGAGNTACGTVAPARLALVDVTLRIARVAAGKTWYFYSGQAIAIVAPGGLSRLIAPPLTQHFVLFIPLDPGDAAAGA